MQNYKKHSNKVSPQVDGWDYYSNEKMDTFTMINLAIKKVAPIKNFPNFAQVIIKMNQPLANGYSSVDESKILSKIESELVSTAVPDNNSIHVAHYTGGGKWIVFFYCNNTETFNETVSEVMAGFAEYRFDINFQEDKEWRVYIESLYPTQWQFRMMESRHYFSQLIDHGVDFSKPRPVEHTVYFKHKTDRENFLKEVKKQGFVSTGKYINNSPKKYRYVLLISRDDKVDLNSVNAYGFEIFKLTKKHYGFYEGWETYTFENETPPATGIDMTPWERLN